MKTGETPIRIPGYAWAILTFINSSVVMAYELILTRFFSALLWYHFVFVAVSITVFGLAIGGLLIQRMPWLRRNWFLMLPLSAAGIMFVMVAVHGLPLTPIWPFYLLFSLPPVVLLGAFQALAFQNFESPGRLYFADLAGAAFAAGATLYSLKYLSIPVLTAILVATLLIADLGVLAFLGRVRARVAFGVRGAVALLFLASMTTGLWGSVHPGQISGEKPLQEMLARDSRARIIWSNWNGMARVDVVQGSDPDRKAIYMDGGAASIMYSPNFAPQLASDPGFFPLANGAHDKVAIIGSGGGKDVWVALQAGAKQVTAIEVNPAVNDAMARFGSFNGNLFKRSDVRPVVGDGRVFFERTAERFDAIYLPLVMTQAADGFGFGLVENYALTIEAFKTYWNKLTQDGQIIMKFHDSLDLMKGLVTALQAAGSPASRNLYILSEGGSGHEGLMYPVLVVRKQPLSKEDSGILMQKAVRGGFRPFFFPYALESALPGLTSGELTSERMIRMAPVNIRPATDDRPFFYDFSNGVEPALITLFAVVLLGAAVITSLAWSKGKPRRQPDPAPWWYFAGLGVAFMAVEIGLIQRNAMLMGSPTASAAVVVGSLLVGGAAGSLFTARKSTWVAGRFGILSAVVAATVILYLPVLGPASRFIMVADARSQWWMSALLFLPLGAVMGIPFPAALDRLKKKTPERVPSAWAVNGAFSVVGSVLAMIVATTAGFSATLVLGALSYGTLSAAAFRARS